MRPFLSVLPTVSITIMCLFGFAFMAILGLLYRANYPQVTLNMSPENIAQAARSCFWNVGIYGALSMVMIWQCALHWMEHRSHDVSVGAVGGKFDDKVAMKKKAV